MKKFWHDIDFPLWERGNLIVSTNEYGRETPVVLEIDGVTQSWMTPDEARELAAVLIRAADAADAAW